MLRSVSVALLGIAPVLAAISPGGAPSGRPPSSLEPKQERGLVEFSHDYQQVVSCTAKKKGDELSCRPKQERGDRGTSLRLRPVDADGALSDEDGRAPVRVRFEDETSPQTEEVELRVGAWEIDWSGLHRQERFRVGDGDEFSIGLSTVAGGCRKVRGKCVVTPAGRRRSVTIPPGHR